MSGKFVVVVQTKRHLPPSRILPFCGGVFSYTAVLVLNCLYAKKRLIAIPPLPCHVFKILTKLFHREANPLQVWRFETVVNGKS